MAKKDYSIDIIVPVYNEEGNLEKLYKEVAKNFGTEKYRLIFVNDGSSDDSVKVIKLLTKKYSNVGFISFSRNFGHQSALRAGLRYSSADAVVSMDADLQHPPKLLPRLVEEWKNGYDIVYTKRNDNDAEKVSIFKKNSSSMFYKVMNKLSGLSIDPGAADFRLLDRKIVDVINDFPEPDLFLRGLVNWIGFTSIAIDYTPAKRFTGTSKYSLKKMLNLALNGITQFSIKPLRMSITIGFLMASIGVIYGVYTLISYFVGNNIASGWTSLIIIILLTSGIQLMLLGIVGEYVGKTFIQTKSRPDYIVAETNIISNKEKI